MPHFIAGDRAGIGYPKPDDLLDLVVVAGPGLLGRPADESLSVSPDGVTGDAHFFLVAVAEQFGVSCTVTRTTLRTAGSTHGKMIRRSHVARFSALGGPGQM